jgi:hypothetical protein
MYIVDNFTENQDCMALVLNHLTEQIKNDKHIYIMKQAKSKVLDMLYMTNTFRVLFGKNKKEETNEMYY